MATPESLVINSIINNGEIGVFFAKNIDALMVSYADVWDFVKTHYHSYRAVPSISTVQNHFPDFESVDTPEHPDYYIDQLRNQYIRGRIQEIMMKAAAASRPDAGMAPAAVHENMLAALQKLNKVSSVAQDTNIMNFDDAEEHYEEVRKVVAESGGVFGIPTGIASIDSAYTTGLVGGDFVVVLGYTGRGKSLLTTLVAANAYNMGKKPMIVSLEMTAEKVRDRIFTILGQGAFSQSELALGDFREDSFKNFRVEHEGDNEVVVVTNDGLREITPNVIQAKIDQHHPDLVVLDYAQLMSNNSMSTDMTTRMRDMSKELKLLATANNIPVVLISSATSNGNVSDEAPMVENVAWSKQLAYDCDLCFAVHKKDSSNVIEVACRKNRNGSMFNFFLDWDIDRGIWKELEFDPSELEGL